MCAEGLHSPDALRGESAIISGRNGGEADADHDCGQPTHPCQARAAGVRLCARHITRARSRPDDGYVRRPSSRRVLRVQRRRQHRVDDGSDGRSGRAARAARAGGRQRRPARLVQRRRLRRVWRRLRRHRIHRAAGLERHRRVRLLVPRRGHGPRLPGRDLRQPFQPVERYGRALRFQFHGRRERLALRAHSLLSVPARDRLSTGRCAERRAHVDRDVGLGARSPRRLGDSGGG
jgi:hypothetical protein